MFGTVIPGNMKAIVDDAHNADPRLKQAFNEYSQDSVPDRPARVRSSQDTPGRRLLLATVTDQSEFLR